MKNEIGEKSKVFAETLYELMEDHGITGKELAAALGVDGAAVYRYLNGDCLPEFAVLKKLCLTFGISADYAFGLREGKEGGFRLAQNTFYERYAKLKRPTRERDHEVAVACRISASAICGWKKGSAPSATSLLKLAEHYHAPLDYLLGLNGD